MFTEFVIIAFATCASPSAFVIAQSPRVEWGIAPDAQRGFGCDRKLRDLERLLRSSDAEDKAALAALRALPGEVEALADQALERARTHKYTEILEDDAPPTLESLGVAFRAALTSAEARLERGRSSAALARMLVDLRFRARARAAAGLALEARELTAALGLLGAQLDGSPSFTDHEADAIARRADLAASRLRAIKLDLTALRADAATDREDIDAAGDRERLKDAIAHGQKTEIARILDDLQAREERAVTMLFTTQLAPKVQPLVRARATAIEKAAAALATVRAAMPDTPEGKKAPADVRDVSKANRYAAAAQAGMAAIAIDPLNDALHYLVAVSVDFQWGIRDSGRWFDRYLALRGIRPSDHRTYKDKQLTAEERRALEALQMPVEPPR